MASVPDMSQQMNQLNKKTESEIAQQKLGVEAQQDYMRDIIGTERSPGAAREYSAWIDKIASPEQVEFQKGQAAGGTHMGFNGANLLRSAAIGRSGGSGVGEGGLRTAYSGLTSALSKGTAGTGVQTQQEQNRARLGFAKIGQGMSDAVISGYNNLGAQQTQMNQTALQAAIEGAKSNLESQAGLMKVGGQVLGGLTSAAAGSFNGADSANPGGFNLEKFGSNLASGWSGGIYRRTA